MSPATEVGFGHAAVEAWMRTLGIDGPLRFSRIGDGQSNLTSLAEDGRGGRWVLRRPPLGTLLASAHDVRREGRVLAALHGTEVPAPRVLGLSVDPEVCDVPLLLMEHVEGSVITGPASAESLTPTSRHAIGLELARTLGRIHAVDLRATGLDDLASHAPYAARQLKRWQGQWERSRTRELPEVDAMAARLFAAQPPPSPVVLVHGDFNLANVVADPITGRVSAVIDWELASLGDPLADLGVLLAYWPAADEPADDLFRAPSLPGFPTRGELIQAYTEATGRAVDHLPFWHALACWKFAIIGEGVIRRTRDEPRNRGTSTISTTGVDALIHRAAIVADEAGL